MGTGGNWGWEEGTVRDVWKLPETYESDLSEGFQ